MLKRSFGGPNKRTDHQCQRRSWYCNHVDQLALSFSYVVDSWLSMFLFLLLPVRLYCNTVRVHTGLGIIHVGALTKSQTMRDTYIMFTKEAFFTIGSFDVRDTRVAESCLLYWIHERSGKWI